MPGKKKLLFILGLVFLTYSNSLFHSFSGDDATLFTGNNFYWDLKHLPKLLSKDFVMRFEDVDFASLSSRPSFSGCVSYRPVVGLSFFLDFFLWRGNPLGHHLGNVLWHGGAAVLVFYFLNLVLKSEAPAFFAALLFALHPIQAETVNMSGYRSDVLLTVFYLSAFIAFIRSRDEEAKPAGRPEFFLAVTYFLFFLALFSKEAAVTFPFVAFFYEVCFFCRGGRDARELFFRRKYEYLGFAGVLAFYLYIYVMIFPNANGSVLFASHFSAMVHFKLMLKILSVYLGGLVWPLAIHVLPPLYAPAVTPGWDWDLVTAGAAIVFAFAGAIFFFRQGNRVIPFFIGWFFAAYLPVSNIILLPNPLAFRFMYLPSIGFFALLAIFLQAGAVSLNILLKSRNFDRILKISVLVFYILATLALNMFFKNTFLSCREMVRRYPDSSKPYFSLGMLYLGAGYYKEARENLVKFLRNNPRNPFVSAMGQDYFVHHQLGRSYADDPDQAIAEFKEAIRLRPDYYWPYADLAAAYFSKKDYEKALQVSLAAISLRPRELSGYVFAMQACFKLGKGKEAYQLYNQASASMVNPQALEYLHKLLENNVPRS